MLASSDPERIVEARDAHSINGQRSAAARTQMRLSGTAKGGGRHVDRLTFETSYYEAARDL
jgi:hypothetical protein